MCYIWLATEEGRAHLQKRSKELKEASSGSSDSTEKVTEQANVARKSTGIETAWRVANQPTTEDTWHIDSCASSHMTYNKALFESINYSDRRDVEVGNGTLLASMGIGTVVITLQDGKSVQLQDVLYVPALKCHLISVGKLIQKGYICQFRAGGVDIIQRGRILAHGVYQDFNDPPSPPVRRRRRQHPNPHQSSEELNDSCRRHIRTAVNNAWAKLDEYYNLTNDSPVYVAALVLHPGHKWKYINERWDRDDWKESAKDAFKSFYERYWQNREVEADSQPVKEERPGSREYDEFQAWMTPHGYYTSQDAAVNDYESYLITPPMKISNLITWWREHKTTYPKLAQMAFDLLSIPAMSAECERVSVKLS
jgi:hypothetical protein